MSSPSQFWQVYHVVNCRHTTPPKDKFVIIVHADGDALGLFINTRPTNWLLNQPKLLVCVTTIRAAEHPFLRYDSTADCQRLYPFLDSELNHRVGQVSAVAKTVILTAIDLCPVLSEDHRLAILTRESWSPKSS